MEKKICTKCNDPKLISEFSPRTGGRPGRTASWCKSCVRINTNKRYKENPILRRGMRRRHREKIIRNQKYVLQYLYTNSCIDCGEKDIRVLDFDHVRGKKKDNICAMVRNAVSIETLKNEMKKCVVRCANDHRRKTCQENGSLRGKLWCLNPNGEGTGCEPVFSAFDSHQIPQKIE